MTTTTATITRSTRIGYGCTSRPEQTATGLRIATPEQTRSGLTARTLLAQRADALRSVGVVGGGGTSHREAVYVGGRLVTSAEVMSELSMLAQGACDSIVVTLAD
jgi:hypothetical protein